MTVRQLPGRPVAAARLAAAMVAASLPFGACDRLPNGPAESPESLEVRGVTLGDWTQFGISSSAGLAAIEEVARIGATAVIFVATIRQATASSDGFDTTLPPSPDFAAFFSAAAHATSLGLDVILKIHVDVADGTWRGFIEPRNPAVWFESYGEFAAICAEAAEAAGARQLIVGTELAGTIRHEDRWRAIITEARIRFGGDVLYAASWDEADRVPFWDAVDFIGIDFWFPVANRPDPGRFEILAEWEPWLHRLGSLRRRTGRDIILTEIGYASRDGAGMSPMTYEGNARPDPQEQADLYWAALESTSRVPWIHGLYWWTWGLREAGGPAGIGFTPRGKPALAELRAAWGGSS